MLIYSSSSYSSSSSSSSSYSSSSAAAASSSSPPSGVSGSPFFLPGLSPNHLGSLLEVLLLHSSYFSFQQDSRCSALTTSQPPSYIFLSVIIRSGICSTLILGVHADLWWVLS